MVFYNSSTLKNINTRMKIKLIFKGHFLNYIWKIYDNILKRSQFWSQVNHVLYYHINNSFRDQLCTKWVVKIIKSAINRYLKRRRHKCQKKNKIRSYPIIWRKKIGSIIGSIVFEKSRPQYMWRNSKITIMSSIGDGRP